MNESVHMAPAGEVWEDIDEHRVTKWIRRWDPAEPVAAVLVGAPFTSGNAKPTGSWAAPDAIRAAFTDFTTYSADFDVDLFPLRVADAGDVLIHATDADESLARIESAIGSLLARQPQVIPIVFGGDHSVTAATVRGFSKSRPGAPLGLIYFDAHTDVRAAQEGVAMAGRPVRSIIESCLEVSGRNVVEVGIHGFMNSSSHRSWLEDRGARIISAREVRSRGIADVLAEALSRAGSGTTGVYVSVDLDVLKQTDGIGAAGRISPEGVDVIDLIEAMYLLGQSPLIKMLDIVELDPRRDSAGITARVAASLTLTFLGGLARRVDSVQP
jgi:formiminoglutamase